MATLTEKQILHVGEGQELTDKQLLHLNEPYFNTEKQYLHDSNEQYKTEKQLLHADEGDATDSEDTASPIIAETNPVPDQVTWPLDNPLHKYATYTYGLTLFILSATEFNTLQQTDIAGGNKWDPTWAIISSAGRYNEPSNNLEFGKSNHAIGRIREFQNVDFFFDNLRMQTIVGMNDRTRSTNAIELSFSIIEPMGMTLLDRIISASSGDTSPIGSKNYMMQPYLLQIDFFGADNIGDITAPIPELRKRIAIRIIEMKIKSTPKGSEYAIRAIPYSHQAFQESQAHTPVGIEVAATTVGQFFSGGDAAGTAAATADMKARAETDAESAKFARLAATRNPNNVVKNATPSPSTVNSFTDAMNAWLKRLVEKDHAIIADEIAFNIDPDIAKSKIYRPISTSPKSKQTITDPKLAAKAAAGETVVSTSDNVNFPINASTSIVDVINLVLRNSEYIKSQIYDPTNKANASFRPDSKVKFYKIIPHMEMLGYDYKRNRYATRTTYNVIPYEYVNTKHPNLPYTSSTKAVKEYQYIYTGKNVNIIDFSVDFDSAFYTSVQVDRANASANNPMPESDDPDAKDATPRVNGTTPTSIAQNSYVYSTGDKGAASTDVSDATDALAANAVKSIYSKSRGDMIQVKLKIVGDPQFIKQDEIYSNPGQSKGISKVNTDGTIAMDNAEVFCRIMFKTPSDMDPSTGLPIDNGEFSDSKFSGVYKILTVDSEFSRGQFVQTLDCIKIFDDVDPKLAAARAARAEEKKQNAQSDIRKLDNAIDKPPDRSNRTDANQTSAETNRLARQQAAAAESVPPENPAESRRFAAVRVPGSTTEIDEIEAAKQEREQINENLRESRRGQTPANSGFDNISMIRF